MSDDFIVYCIDTETTGTDPLENDIIEISMWRSSDDDQKTWYIRAVNENTISDKALKVNGHKKEDILLKTAYGKQTYKEPSDIIEEIEAWVMFDGAAIEDRIFMGQNPQFDLDFLKNMWKRADCAERFPFSNYVIDTLQLVKFIDLCTGKKRKYYNLSALVKEFGISKTKAHRASEDVKMTKDLFYKIINIAKPQITELFKDFYTE